MTDAPAPLVPADLDLRDVPMPRELLVRIAMETFGLTADEADQLVQQFFANGPQ